MNFSREFPEKLRARILLSDVVSKKVKLKKTGKDYLGLCPFHNEKTPSFHVNDHKGFYHCFGCQAHGDIITFTMEQEKLGFKEAVLKLANDHGIEVPIVAFNSNISPNYNIGDFEIAEKINEFFEKNLYEQIGKNARDYLKKRGFNSKIAKKFHIGYAPNSYDALKNHLQNLGFSQELIEKCGVIGKNDAGKLYDKLRNRITFAITDRKNRIIAFGGRSMGDEMPKYLNSAETDIFKKSQTIYNFYNAKPAIMDEGFAILVEGYVDCISVSNAGCENVVAGLGTAISDDHIKQLFSVTDKIIICLDGDNAGYKASKRVLELALPIINSKKNLEFCFIPNKMDPDEFIKNFGILEFKKLLQSSKPASKALIEFICGELQIDMMQPISPENKARLEFELSQKISQINDVPTKKYFNLFVRDTLFSMGKKIKNINIYSSNKLIIDKNPGEFHIQNAIIGYLIKFPELINYVDNEFNIYEHNFVDEKFNEMKDFIINLIQEGNKNIIEELDKSDFKIYNDKIRKVIALLNSNNLHKKFRLLLLKELLIKVERQYKENLNENDDDNAHQAMILSQKTTEFFKYKQSLELEIRAISQEIEKEI